MMYLGGSGTVVMCRQYLSTVLLCFLLLLLWTIGRDLVIPDIKCDIIERSMVWKLKLQTYNVYISEECKK